MATPTPAEIIEKIDVAIGAILDGGAVVQYSIGGRSLQRASLADLRALREQYSAAAVPAGGFRLFVEFDSAGPGVDDDS